VKLFAFEQQAIGPIPIEDRRGRSRELVAIWFGMNMSPITIVTGAGATVLFGLSLWWSIAAFVIGHVIGGIGMALHAAQGPRLGVPQMLQARGQFGSYGAAIVLVIALIMFIGIFSSNLLVASSSFTAIAPHLDTHMLLVLSAMLSFLVAAYGYFVVRRLAALGSYVVGGLVLVALIAILVSGKLGPALSHGSFQLVGFLSMIAIGVVWQLGYAPYVSDYSRYMPVDTGSRGAFWGSFVGSVASSILLMTVGAIVGLITGNEDTMAGLQGLVGGWVGFIVLASLGIVVGTVNSINLYSSCLTLLSLIETFIPGWNPTTRARVISTVGLAVVGVSLAFSASSNFAAFWFSFLNMCLYALIPWSIVNLLDYYVIRKGSYSVMDFYAPGGGVYGRWNLGALISFAIGVAAQLPFMSLSFYKGPVSQALGGVDIAWLVGLVAAAVAYLTIVRYPLGRTALSTAERAVPAAEAP
jgi:nucleobase:cation symporter-1, NCS1 family